MNEEKKCFVCLGADCPNHCCGAYNGFSGVLQPLGNVGFSEIILLPEDVERLQKAGLGQFVRWQENGTARMDTAPDGVCAALVEGRCAIYASRPAICRAYPLYLDMFAGVCALKECPAITPEFQLENHSEALKSLLDIYQYWIDCYRKP